MKKLFPGLLLVLCFFQAAAQPKGESWNVSAGIALPFGNFSETHFPGAGAAISYSKGRYGLLPAKPAKQFGYSLQANAHYYFGKNETVSGHSFRYPGYLLFHLFGGAICQPGKRTYIELVAGPGLGYYNSSTRFNLGGTLSATYYIRKRLGVSPSILLTKESGADWLGALSLRGCWVF